MTQEIKNFKFKNGLPVEIEILDISDLFKRVRKDIILPHRNDFHNIMWITRGNPTFSIDFQPVTVPEKSLIFVRKDSVRSYDSEENYDGKVILFTNKFFNMTSDDIRYMQNNILFSDLYAITPVQVKEKDIDLDFIFKGIESELKKEHDAAQDDILRNYLHNFLLISERLKREQGFVEMRSCPDFEQILQFKKLIENNYKSEKSVQKYAELLNMSEKKLYNITTRLLDKTPKEIINECVVLEARRLLAYSKDSVKEIAYYLGFEEPTNFIKYFRKSSLTTPNEFRENFRYFRNVSSEV